MRPSATESSYKVLETQEGAYDYKSPAGVCIRPSSSSDLDQVVELERAGFPAEERATQDKIEYRLKVCPESCAGVFKREFDWDPSSVEPVETNTDSHFGGNSEEMHAVTARKSVITKETLIGHIIATKTASKYVTDESMKIGGHDESGHTIAVHSVVVHPDHQGHHIGYIMMKDYVQKFFGSCTADQMSLLAHKELVPFYKKHGFRDEGASESNFGGQPWRASRLPFDTYDDENDEMLSSRLDEENY